MINLCENQTRRSLNAQAHSELYERFELEIHMQQSLRVSSRQRGNKNGVSEKAKKRQGERHKRRNRSIETEREGRAKAIQREGERGR